MAERHSQGEILLAALVFTSQAGAKKRPVMVIRDAGDDDLLVAPTTGQAARVAYDVVLNDWGAPGSGCLQSCEWRSWQRSKGGQWCAVSAEPAQRIGRELNKA